MKHGNMAAFAVCGCGCGQAERADGKRARRHVATSELLLDRDQPARGLARFAEAVLLADPAYAHAAHAHEPPAPPGGQHVTTRNTKAGKLTPAGQPEAP
jgi:hypothetical protein